MCFIGKNIRARSSKKRNLENGATIFQANISKLWRTLDTVDLEELPDWRERAGAPVLWLSCEGQIDVWKMFSDNSFLSAVLDRQGLQVAAPIDLGTKKTEFLATAATGLLAQAQEKESQDCCDIPNCGDEELQEERSAMATVPLVYERGTTSNTWRKTVPYLDLVVEKVQYLQKKYHCQWTLLRGEKPKWNFHNSGNLLHPLESAPASRERVVPTEFGDCISRAKVIQLKHLNVGNMR